MKLLLLLALILPMMDQPAAVARICGNVVVHDFDKDKAITRVKEQGCQEVRLVELENDYYLVYGIKVLRSELKSDLVGGATNDY
jgi:hypothetical protein